jgi:hypothetical protein
LQSYWSHIGFPKSETGNPENDPVGVLKSRPNNFPAKTPTDNQKNAKTMAMPLSAFNTLQHIKISRVVCMLQTDDSFSSQRSHSIKRDLD